MVHRSVVLLGCCRGSKRPRVQHQTSGVFFFFFTLFALQSFPPLRMDSGKLPNYRSSYLFRFHPYARVKPSARELVMAALYPDDDDDDGPVSDEQPFIPSYGTVVPDSNPSSIIAQSLDSAVNVTHSVNAPRRKLSMSTLVVDLALLMCRKPSPTA
ncbi:hypothetical protein EDD17DRAFT_1666429 [Pisolithus thermaeus]|nr:hypothetical protein EDD17DRAFT_1666429 [Pisolithus thermaeus]